MVAVRTARRVLVATVCLLSTAVACGPDGAATGITDNPAPTASGRRKLPDVLLADLDGSPVRLGSLAGTPLVLNYWYATCPPCREEMPVLAELSAEFGGRVRFVGVNPQDNAETARSVAAERGVTFEQLLDSTQRSVDALSLTGFPSTVFVRADGTIAQTVRRALTADELRSLIAEDLLA